MAGSGLLREVFARASAAGCDGVCCVYSAVCVVQRPDREVVESSSKGREQGKAGSGINIDSQYRAWVEAGRVGRCRATVSVCVCVWLTGTG